MTAAAANHAQTDRVVVFCPECGHRYALKPEALAQPGLKVLCGTCESVFTPGDKPTPRPVAAVGAVRQTVVVAHESPAVCATVGRVLEDSGYAARYVHDGARAVAAFDVVRGIGPGETRLGDDQAPLGGHRHQHQPDGAHHYAAGDEDGDGGQVDAIGQFAAE